MSGRWNLIAGQYGDEMPSRRSQTYTGGGRNMLLLISLFLVLVTGGCSLAATPVRAPHLRAEPTAAPVIFVPGSTGSTLRDRITGQVVWGRGANLVGPFDRGHAIALPVSGSTDDHDRIVAGTIIEQIRLAGIFKKQIYGPLMRTLEAHGYQAGDLDDPQTGDTLFAYAYDWRHDTIDSANKLAEGLQRLRLSRGEEQMPVVLVCQSTGVNLCRYLVKYGACSGDEAAAGDHCSLAGVEVSTLIMIAPSSGGSLRTFSMIDRGRRYLRPFRKFAPETIFTFAGLYQDLPVYRQDLFVDQRGEPLAVDLLSAESWQTYGWSIYQHKVRRRLERSRYPDLLGNEQQREVFLQSVLDDAARFHALLRRDSQWFGEPRYHLIGSSDQDTSERAVLVNTTAGWQTHLAGDRDLRHHPHLAALISAPGDGHATHQSQLWLSPQELAVIDEPFLVPGPHFEVIIDPNALRHLLEILLG
jgi:hypothetical protein